MEPHFLDAEVKEAEAVSIYSFLPVPFYCPREISRALVGVTGTWEQAGEQWSCQDPSSNTVKMVFLGLICTQLHQPCAG